MTDSIQTPENKSVSDSDTPTEPVEKTETVTAEPTPKDVTPMFDTPAEKNDGQPSAEEEKAKSTATIFYAIGLVTLFIPLAILVVIIGSIVCNKKTLPTWIQGHYKHQLKTSLIFVVLGVIGMLTAAIFIGLPILIGAYIYFYYKMIKGLMRLRDDIDA